MNNRGFRYKILSHVGPFEKNLIYLPSLSLLEFYRFFSFLFILLSYSKPLIYASPTNTEEVAKFYNLGDRTFEIDFNNQKIAQIKIETG